MSRIARLELDLPGLLTLLGEHLYSDPRVAVRELVQNAHDSIVRARLQGQLEGPGRIEMSVRERDGREELVLRDDGLGLDDDEIITFLATIGRGQTGTVRREHGATGPAAVDDLVGQFGVGLLSAFLVGDRVTLTTRKRDREQGWRWTCDGQQTYALDEASVPWPGTEVVVRLEPGHPFGAGLAATVAHYARFLPTPVWVDGERINPVGFPWEPGGLVEEELALELTAGQPPLTRVALQPFVHPDLGAVALHGLLVIPAGSRMSVLEHGTVDVYIRRMRVADRHRDLLPRWARFVTGVIDCPRLQPTASREDLRREAAYHAVKAEVERQLLAFLATLQTERTTTWSRVVEAHEPLLKRWAVHEPALFEAVADQVTFRTSRGPCTLPRYLEQSGGTLYYFGHEAQARTMHLLLESTQRPVIDAQYLGDEPFLRLYGEVRGVPVVREAADPGEGFVTHTSGDAVQRTLDALGGQGLRVVPARFEPASLPVLLHVPRRLLAQERAADEARKAAAAPIAGLLQHFSRPAARLARTLYVNVDHPLIRRLEELDDDRRTAAAAIVREQARLLAGERLDAQALVASAAALGEAVLALVGDPPPESASVDASDEEPPPPGQPAAT